MTKHSHTKRPFFRLCAGTVLLMFIFLLGITASLKFLTAVENRKRISPKGYVTSQQMKLAIPYKAADESALYKCLQKAHNGKKITAGFIGGSITIGKMSVGAADACVDKKLSYVEYFSRWWRQKFPEAGLDVVNAGINATDSYLGVHRVQKDILDQKPDLVVVEFAVNDQMTNLHKQSYENLVRRILTADFHPAVLLLFMSRTNGKSCQFHQIQIGKHYHLPMLSYGNVMEDMLRHGMHTADELSGDGIHPSALGSAIAGEILTRYLEIIYEKQPWQIVKRTAPSSYLTSEEYKNAEVLSCNDLNIKNMGTFRPVNKSTFFSGNLECCSGDGNLEFTVTCKNLGVLYVRLNDKSGGQFDIYVDGKKTSEINADNRGAHNNQPGTVPCFFSNSMDTHTIRISKKKNSTGNRLILYAVLISE